MEAYGMHMDDLKGILGVCRQMAGRGMTDAEAAVTESRRNTTQERAYDSLMLELDEMDGG